MREIAVPIVLAIILITYALFIIEPLDWARWILNLVPMVQLTVNKIALSSISQRGLCLYSSSPKGHGFQKDSPYHPCKICLRISICRVLFFGVVALVSDFLKMTYKLLSAKLIYWRYYITCFCFSHSASNLEL